MEQRTRPAEVMPGAGQDDYGYDGGRRRRRRLQPRPAETTQADEIQRLADLHASGALTDEEFAAAKAKALGI